MTWIANLPPNKKRKDSFEYSAMDQVDAVQHLGASRTGEGLSDAEQLLVLFVSVSLCSICRATQAYNLLIDPSQFVNEFIMELVSSVKARKIARVSVSNNLEVDRRSTK